MALFRLVYGHDSEPTWHAGTLGWVALAFRLMLYVLLTGSGAKLLRARGIAVVVVGWDGCRYVCAGLRALKVFFSRSELSRMSFDAGGCPTSCVAYCAPWGACCERFGGNAA